jgi:hypothetical protein
MTYGSRQRHPKNRATQPRPRFAAAVRATARCRRALGARLLYLSGTGISLSAASAAAERAGGRGRVEVGIHGETAAQLDSAGAVIRLCQGTFDQRSGQPYVAHAAATRPRARSWLSRSRFRHALFSWSIVSIACCRRNWPKPIRFWCRINAGQSQPQSPPASRKLRTLESLRIARRRITLLPARQQLFSTTRRDTDTPCRRNGFFKMKVTVP